MRVLIVEDETLIADGVRRGLLRAGFVADVVGNAEAARAALQAEGFDLAVIDIGLPREDGLQLVRSLRARRVALPLMMLTARDRVSDRVSALDLGADDYLTKPFHVDELVARCRALIRRAHAAASSVLEFGRLRLDLAGKEAFTDGHPLDLTQREWSILECLVLSAGRLVTKERLMSAVSDWTDELTPNAVEVYVSRVRAKIGEAAQIRTVRGLGYQIREPGK
ncbi:MAG TPA: response regulator transcription factor [Steroidobacteraceae bacterium]|jgi:DNA-binding response OmpR family regulator|nr:response regulator transcription factor [Steroidobacteraceae bacterium]